ncbi:MAG: hypothetical protein HYY20_02710 [Candidatus Tectomicrobia bacterium]|uniref:Lipid/polyisoprenoid-binding YceI-like domain-containing protein n=1 Tax=Tectimicrobiota bacterium TaxID=2528274 RepID=A0A932FXS0_UNCTE|nr:hypothetical protein [Candidatus Tectomicrobia bacterium]
MRIRKWAIGALMVCAWMAMAVAAQAADSLKFVESYVQSLKSFKFEGETFSDIVTRDSYKISGKISLADRGIGLEDLTDTTTFSISMGSFAFEGTLGEATSFSLGAKGGRPVLSLSARERNSPGNRKISAF